MKSHFITISSSLTVGAMLCSGVSTLVSSSLPILAQQNNSHELLKFKSVESLDKNIIKAEIPARWEPQAYQPPEISLSDVEGFPLAVEGFPLAIVPTTSFGFGTTVSAYPTFLIYLPANDSQETLRSVSFTLTDPKGTEIYRITSSRPPRVSDLDIVRITLPNQVGIPPLKVNIDYHWQFEVMWETEETQTVQGWIRRVQQTSELQAQLQQAKPHEQARLYAQAEIWYDAAAILAQLHQSNPQNQSITNDWIKLLDAAELEQITQSGFSSAPSFRDF